MGLDMFLSKKTYVKNWEHTPPEQRHVVRVTRNGQPVDTTVVNPERVTYIVEDVGYWRKANAIHRWFVDNVQDGEDNCGAYYVSREDLQKLLQTVERVLDASELVDGQVTTGHRLEDGRMQPIVQSGKVIKDPTDAKLFLPTLEGFYFGGTDYDDWYVENLLETKRILEAALKDETGEFEYSSSW